jgi:hypothetical protein
VCPVVEGRDGEDHDGGAQHEAERGQRRDGQAEQPEHDNGGEPGSMTS